MDELDDADHKEGDAHGIPEEAKDEEAERRGGAEARGRDDEGEGVG